MRDAIVEQTGIEDLMFCDGYDDCLIGISERFGQSPVALYDIDLIIAKLEADGLTNEEAEEHFYFNMIGAWVGEFTPSFMRRVQK